MKVTNRVKKQILKLLLVLSCLFSFMLSTGCNYYKDKLSSASEPEEDLSEGGNIEVSYPIVHAKVFAPKCINCHGSLGGVNLESYDSVLQHLSAVGRAVENGTMPKSGPLSNAEKKLVLAWIQAGAPHDPVAAPPTPPTPPVPDIPSPTPPEEPPPDTSPGAPIPEEKLTYKLVHREVFQPRCIACHGASGGVNLQSYGQVKANLKAIKRAALVNKTMPPDGPLTARQRNILSKWIALGAPQNGKPPSTPNPPDNPNQPPEPQEPPEPVDPVEPEEPLAPLFSSIHKNIFSVRCLTCHSETGSGKRIPLNTKEDLLNSPLELVIPGNPDESGLVIAVERKDSKRMPPPETGGPLNEKEIQTIRIWIQSGAKD